jgi:hypothetical protein
LLNPGVFEKEIDATKDLSQEEKEKKVEKKIYDCSCGYFY